ncbi:CbiQ family ECF transporter T component [Streptococcus cuniculi]|uniref:Cobalt ABC transporter permease n=1 Tax=Streptococcus cuniculi TaxID=1432788 RepID=A0A4Y9JFQ3_9STRE|nr:CbiQ family ECF transporter T component [Streptococcus cuniculi]MBF0777635.1 cobalt ABC transporter permease [Streptococcus cuniculi]TFU98675.1 cobalt ABC transporter permease [Streptococcus cuniculi]
MFVIDKYAYQNRWRGVKADYKFLFYVFLLIISFSGIVPLQLGLLMTVVLLTCYVARMSISAYLKWHLHAIIFIFISLLTFVVTYHADKGSFLIALPFFKGYLGINGQSLQQAGFIVLRIYCSLVATYFFALTVPFTQMVQLFKKIHVPLFLLEIVVLMYRFIFLVLYEFLTIRDTLDLKFAFYKKRKNYKALGMLAHTLFTKLLDDNERLNEVLTLKFDGYQRE